MLRTRRLAALAPRATARALTTAGKQAPPLQLQLFTRKTCGLCDAAQRSLAKLQEQRKVVVDVIDVDAPGNEGWQQAYQFQVPVIRHEASERSIWGRIDHDALDQFVNDIDAALS